MTTLPCALFALSPHCNMCNGHAQWTASTLRYESDRPIRELPAAGPAKHHGFVHVSLQNYIYFKISFNKNNGIKTTIRALLTTAAPAIVAATTTFAATIAVFVVVAVASVTVVAATVATAFVAATLFDASASLLYELRAEHLV